MRVNWILRLYPAAWRERYQEEMQALLEMHTITVATAMDLLFGALNAWLDPVYPTKEGFVSQKFLDALINSISYFDRFSAPAKKIVNLAGEEVQYFQHETLGTEHLLLGLLREEESIAARVLASLDVTLEKVRKAVEEAKGRGSGAIEGEITLSSHARTVMKMAVAEADRMYPQTDFPLLGTSYMPVSEALQILQDGEIPSHLKDLDVTLEKIGLAVEEAKGRGDNVVAIQIETGMAPFANKPENADDWHHPLLHIDTENLLLGMLRVPESTAVQILQGLGVPPIKDIRKLIYLEDVTTFQTNNQGYTQRFTRQARKAWSLAQEESRRRQDSYLGAPHLLLGLAGAGVAASELAQMGVGPSEICIEFERMYGRGERSGSGDIKLQAKLSHVIELASNEARRLGHRFIGTGHLLLVLIREEGLEAGILENLGVDLDKLRRAIRQALHVVASMSEQEGEADADEIGDEELYAPHASIASIEQSLQGRELDKTMQVVYPFTLEARNILSNAQIEAKRLDQRVGPEHLLVGLAFLTFRSDGAVSRVLKGVGIDFEKAQVAVEKRTGRGVPAVVLVQSALCNACLLLAADEAERRDGPGASIKSEHLLLGLLREEKGIIADLLTDLGTSVEIVRANLLATLGSQNSELSG